MIKFYNNNTSFPRSRRRAFDTVHTIKHVLEMRVLKTSAPQRQEAAGGKIVIFNAAPIWRCPYGMDGVSFVSY